MGSGSATNPDTKAVNSKKETLLAKLGGSEALMVAVDKFYGNVTADPELQQYFVGVSVKLLKWHQVRTPAVRTPAFPFDSSGCRLLVKL